MKLSELKTEVYRLAEVSTTKQLKAKYAEVQSLDMRYKASWQQVLEQLNDLKAKEGTAEDNGEDSVEFQNWLNNPPDEYKDLFAEAGAALTAIDDKLEKGRKLTKTARAMAESLNEFAEASLEEARQLEKADRQSRDRLKQADLN